MYENKNKYNIDRGKIQFDQKLKLNNVKYPNTLELLKDYFIDHVAVMETKEELSNDLIEQGYSPRVEYFSASRMAKSCIDISNEIELCNANIYAMAIDRYFQYTPNIYCGDIDDDGTNEKINSIFMDEIIKTNNEDLNDIGDINNLISEMDENDLSIEGKRAVGYLPKDFNTLNPGESIETHDINQLPLAIITEDQDGYAVLNCPNCLSTDIYDNGFSRYTCMDCETKFKSPLSLGDIIPDNT